MNCFYYVKVCTDANRYLIIRVSVFFITHRAGLSHSLTLASTSLFLFLSGCSSTCSLGFFFHIKTIAILSVFCVHGNNDCSREQDTSSCLVAGTLTLTHTWCHSASPFGVSRHLGDTSSEKAGQSLEQVVSLDPSPPLPSGVSDVAICQTRRMKWSLGQIWCIGSGPAGNAGSVTPLKRGLKRFWWPAQG